MKKNKHLIIIGIGLFIYFFFIETKEDIVNYPSNLQTYVFVTVFIIISIIYFFRNSFRNPDWLAIGMKLLQGLISSWFLTGILLLPFNYYLISNIDNKPIETLDLPLKKVSVHSGNKCFFYEYQDEAFVMYGYKPIMQKIWDNKNERDYFVRFNVRKGNLNTMKIEKWEILLK